MTSRNGYLIEQDDADRWLWARVLEDMPKLRDLQEKAEQDKPGSQALLRDLFAALFKAKPVLKPPKTGSQQQRYALLSELMESQDYRRLRLTTRLREFTSAVASMELFSKLLESWPLDDDVPDPESAPTKTGEASQTGDASVSDQVAARLRQLVREACDKTEQMEDAIEAWGTEQGALNQLDLAEASALAEQVQRSSLLQQIAMLAGRMKRLALTKYAARVRHGTDEIVSIHTGSALERVLPQELVALRNPALRQDFFRRFCEGNLLQYELSGRETLGRGPVIVCLDSSSSMKGVREVWAKAVTLALLTVARKERRDFALIHFGAASECRVFRFPWCRASPTAVIEALAFAFHGGTNFERPLRETLDLIEASKFSKADVIFITDGACKVSDSFLKEFRRAKDRKAFRVFSVLIDTAGRTSSTTLEAFSNEVFCLSDLAEDVAVLEGLFGRS